MDRNRYVSRSFVQMPSITYVERQVSPIIIRTIEKVPLTFSRSPDNSDQQWKQKYFDLKFRYQQLENKYNHLQSQTSLNKDSEIKQISQLFTQSQYDIQQLKSCLHNVDRQMNDDYKQRYEQVNQQLEIVNSNYAQLQKQLQMQLNHQDFSKLIIEKDNALLKYKDQIKKLIQHIQELEQIHQNSAMMQNEIERLNGIIQEQQREMSEYQLRYSELFNSGTRYQEQLGIIAMHYAEIDSLRNQLKEKEQTILSLRNQILMQYKL